MLLTGLALAQSTGRLQGTLTLKHIGQQAHLATVHDRRAQHTGRNRLVRNFLRSYGACHNPQIEPISSDDLQKPISCNQPDLVARAIRKLVEKICVSPYDWKELAFPEPQR